MGLLGGIGLGDEDDIGVGEEGESKETLGLVAATGAGLLSALTANA